MKSDYKLRLLIALFWLLVIYIFLPFTPDVINLLFRRLGSYYVKALFVLLSIIGTACVYLPFVSKFRKRKPGALFAATFVLVAAGIVNIFLMSIPAQMLHIPEYAVLAVFLYRAFTLEYGRKKGLFLSTVTGITAGIIDERIIQYVLPTRYYNIEDVLLNIAGIITGVVLISIYRCDEVNHADSSAAR
ncbi:MAG: VanZ family protein [Candidatus Omnitrophota bacterium]